MTIVIILLASFCAQHGCAYNAPRLILDHVILVEYDVVLSVILGCALSFRVLCASAGVCAVLVC